MNTKNTPPETRQSYLTRSLLKTSITPLVALSLALAGSMDSHAASGIWTGLADSTWANTGNWDTSPVPGTGDMATFNGLGNGNTTIDLGSGVTVSNVLFDLGTAAYTVGGGAVGSQALSLNPNGGLTVNANNQLINANLSLATNANAAITITNNGSGLLTLAGGITGNVVSGNGVVTIGGSGNTLLSGVVTKPGAGNMALLKAGAGLLTISTNGLWSGSGAIGYVPATSAGFPLVDREGTLLFSGGSNYVNGELVIGGVVANGGAGQNAKIIVDRSTLNVSSWFSIGRGNGIGGVSSDLVLTNAATVIAANLSAGFNGGNAANLPKGSITMGSNSTFTITGNGAVNFAESLGSDFTWTLNDSAQFIAAGTGLKHLGYNGKGTVNLNGNSSMILGNQTAYIGRTQGTGSSTGIVNMASSGIFSVGGDLRVGGSQDNGAGRIVYGALNISSGTVNLSSLTIGRGNNNQNQCTGVVTQNGGTVTSTNDVIVGYAGTNSYGQYVLNNGTLNIGPAVGKWLMVGSWDFTDGRLDINGGTLNLMNNTSIKMNRQTGVPGPLGGNVVNQNGGTVNFYSDAGITLGGIGNLDLVYSGAASSVNTYNLNGGTLNVPQVACTTANGSRTFNFNGGTLRAVPTTLTSSFMSLGSGTVRINVRNGGALIDSNGRDIAIVQSLDHSDVAGDNATDGGLTKTGAGTLTLAGGASYTGPTAVNAGGLAVDVSSGNVYTTGPLTVNGANLTVISSGGYNTFPMGNATLQNTVALNFDYGTLSTAPSQPFINASGNLNVSGSTITINLNGFGLQIGTVSLIKYAGTFTGTLANFTLGTLPPGVSATLVNNTGNKSIDLNITSTGQNLSWYGYVQDAGILSSNWDITLTTNWVSVGGTSPARYQEYTTTTTVGDPVRFDDTLFTSDPSGNIPTNIYLTTTLRPYTVVVDSSSYPYQFSGPGGIGGQGSLIKSNTGSLTLSTSNSYSGGTFLYGGTVFVSADNQLGASNGAVTLGSGNLEFTANTTNSRPISVTALSSLTVDSGATAHLRGRIFGAQRLNMDGPGTKILTNNANRFQLHARGGTTILDGNSRLTNDVNWTSIAPLYDATAPSADARLIIRSNAFFDAGNFDFNVSDSALANSGDSARLDIQDNGTLRFRNLWIGKGLQATGLVYQAGGFFTNAYTAGADLRIGGNAVDQVDTFGGFYLSGGRANFGRLLQVGAYGIGEMIVSGSGQFSNSAAVVVARFSASRGTLNVSGGSFSVGSDLIVGENGEGTMTVSGTGVALATSPLSIGGFGAPGTGTVSVVTGGKLIVPQVRMMPVAGLSTFNFNGGTLQASASSSAFINNLTAANILSGGAIIDSSSNSITIAQNLVDAGGGGGLTKLGTGTLTLLGTNNYTGATVVSAGNLLVSPIHQTPSSAVTVAAGASFGVYANTTGAATVGNLTLGSAASDRTALAFAFTANPASFVLQAGVVTISGTNSIRLSGSFVAGTIPLIKYTSLSGSGLLNPSITAPQGMTAVLSNDVANTTLYAIVTGEPGIVWTGTNSTPILANVWANGVTNWLAAGLPAAYLEANPPGDPVMFNDIGSASVLLSNTVSPASVTVSNNSVLYTFSGTGKISGTTSLKKIGTGTVILGISGNDYTGSTIVSNGTLQLSSATAIPDGATAAAVNIGSAGTLDLNGFSETINGLAGSGRIENSSTTASVLTLGNGNGNVNWNGIIDSIGSGGNSIIKVGTGAAVITGTNYLRSTAASQVNGGSLLLTNGASVVIPSGEFWVQQNAGTSSVVVAGATLLVSNNWLVIGRNNAAADGTLTVNSGTVQKAGTVGNIVVGSLNATGRLIVNGGQVLNSAMLWLGENASANATLQLNGGLVQATQVRPNNAVASSVANFNGGTLQASGNNPTNFLATTVSCYVQSGGAIIDDGGFVIAIPAALSEDGNSPGGGLIKKGSGTLYLDGYNSYSGTTVVSNGTLGGIGTITGPVVVRSGAALAPGDNSIGTFTVGSTPTLQGSVVMQVDRNGGSPINDLLEAGSAPLVYGGTLVVTNSGADLQVGDSFKLFNTAGGYSGSFTVVSQTPNQTVTWNTSSLTVDGTITVATVGSPIANYPTNITYSVSSGTLSLSWPSTHLGWVLQMQTNSLSKGLSTNWADIAGSDTITSTNISIGTTNPAVFFRLRMP